MGKRAIRVRLDETPNLPHRKKIGSVLFVSNHIRVLAWG